MIDFSEFVEAAESCPDSAQHQLGMLSNAAYNAGMWDSHPEVKAAKEKITAIGNRSAAEKRKATIAARKARPRIIDTVSSNASQVEVLHLAVDRNIDLLAPEAGKVPDAEWEEWAEAFRTAEAGMRRARLRLEALRAGEVLPVCAQCGEAIVGRSDARYCSTRCRVAAHRAKPKAAKSKEPTVEELNRRADEFEARMIAEGKWKTRAERKADWEAHVDEVVQSLIDKKKPKAKRKAEDRAYAAELNQAMAAKPKRR